MRVLIQTCQRSCPHLTTTTYAKGARTLGEFQGVANKDDGGEANTSIIDHEPFLVWRFLAMVLQYLVVL